MGAEDGVVREPAESRWWFRVVSAGAFVALVTPLVAVLVLVGPFLRDDRRLDHVVRAVALDWRDFGRDAAVTRLQYELDRQRIGAQVTDDHCALTTLEHGAREVRCAWVAEVRAFGRVVPLTFESLAHLTAEGDLR